MRRSIRAEFSATRAAMNLGRSGLAIGLVTLVLYGGLTCFRLGTPDLGQDEGRFGLSALNVLGDYHNLARVAEDEPHGGPGTKPYVYPLAIAASLTIFGDTNFALRLVNVLALAVAGIFFGLAVYKLTRNRRIALFTFALFILNPQTISYARTAMPEPLLVTWGCIGLFAAANFYEEGRLRWAAAAGVALGMGFLVKLWLILPIALAVFLLLGARYLRQPGRPPVWALAVALLLFLAVSGSHLALVWLLTPTEMGHWLGLYFGVTVASRFGGSGYAPYWIHPWWFYLLTGFRASFWGLPLLGLGMWEVIERRAWVAAAMVAALASPLLGFSLLTVKQSSYVYPATLALTMLIAMGADRLLSHHTELSRILLCMPLAVPPVFWVLKSITGAEFAAIELLYLLFTGVALGARAGRSIAREAAVATMLLAMLAGAALIVRSQLQGRTYYREIADVLRPRVQPCPPGELSFVAPEYAALSFALFRGGEYWDSFYYHQGYAEFEQGLRSGARAFYVVDPQGTLYGGAITPEKMAALQLYGKDDTAQVERAIGHRLPVRIFIPHATACQTRP